MEHTECRLDEGIHKDFVWVAAHCCLTRQMEYATLKLVSDPHTSPRCHLKSAGKRGQG